MANWAAHLAGFSPAIRAQLLPYAQVYDQCMLAWDANRRFFQKEKYHGGSTLPLAVSPWNGRSPFDLSNLGIAWYVPRRQTVRAYGR